MIMGAVAPPPETQFDVLVVGAGPSGAAAAYWLAERGRRVLMVEKKRFPREKTCGDGLTPRAVAQLTDMGLAEGLTKYHRYQGLRATARTACSLRQGSLNSDGWCSLRILRSDWCLPWVRMMKTALHPEKTVY